MIAAMGFTKESSQLLLVLLVVLALFFLNINVVYYTSHTMPLIGLAKALSQGSFFLDPSYCQYVDVVLVNGKCIFAALPGLPLIIAPFLRVLGESEALATGGATVAFFGFLAVLSTWLFSKLFIQDEKKALLCAVAVSLGGPLWIYSTHIFPQAPLAFTYTLLTYMAVKALRRELRVLEYAAAGFIASLMVLLDPAMVTAIAALALIVLAKLVHDAWRGNEGSSRIITYALLFALGATPLALFLLLYNSATTGNPLLFPEHLWLKRIGVPYPGFTTPIPLGLYILLVDLRKGLIPLYPVFAVALACIPKLLKAVKSSYEKVLYIAALLIPLITHSAWYDVDGGLSFGPRFAVPVTTLLAPPLIYASESKRKAVRVATLLTVLYGVAVNTLTTTVTPYPSTLEDLKPWQNQFIHTVLPLLSNNTRSSYLYNILRKMGEPVSTVVAVAVNLTLSIAALVVLYSEKPCLRKSLQS